MCVNILRNIYTHPYGRQKKCSIYVQYIWVLLQIMLFSWCSASISRPLSIALYNMQSFQKLRDFIL